MLDALPWMGLALSLAASAYCWRRIWASNDYRFYKRMIAEQAEVDARLHHAARDMHGRAQR